MKNLKVNPIPVSGSQLIVGKQYADLTPNDTNGLYVDETGLGINEGTYINGKEGFVTVFEFVGLDKDDDPAFKFIAGCCLYGSTPDGLYPFPMRELFFEVISFEE